MILHNDITYGSLSSVIENRVRLTRNGFDHPSPAKGDVWYGFPNSTQIMAQNASEYLAADQISSSITVAQFNSVGTPKYVRALLYSTLLASEHSAYQLCTRASGDAILDLLRTLSNDPDMWDIPESDPNFLDLNEDPTGGTFSFYSPDDSQWAGISAALLSGTTTFPSAGGFESIVCNMLPAFCLGNPPTNASYLQVVIVDEIPNNDCTAGKNSSPQFVFIRWRNDAEASVIMRSN